MKEKRVLSLISNNVLINGLCDFVPRPEFCDKKFKNTIVKELQIQGVKYQIELYYDDNIYGLSQNEKETMLNVKRLFSCFVNYIKENGNANKFRVWL